ncbi:MAG: sugar transferase [Tannerella sp.]|jgi:exopolysaccharide biosynthesis polyprenyl glycosylphosphotransferase|nr:sugar transferase [Tannerella sp.]
MNKVRQTAKYILADLLMAMFAWLLLNIIRYHEVAQFEGFTTLLSFLLFHQVLKGEILIPIFWLILYYFSGYYNSPFAKSRINELFNTFVTVSMGVVSLFFVVVLDDLPDSFHIYYLVFFSYFGMQFFFTYLCRFLITNHALRKVKQRKWLTNALVIGSGSRAAKFKNELLKLGYRIVGFVDDGSGTVPVVTLEELLGNLDDLPGLLTSHSVDELVLVPDNQSNEDSILLLYSLYHYNLPVKIRLEKNNPLLRAEVKTIHGIPLIDVTKNNFSDAGKNIKFMMDKIIATLVLILLSPLYAYLAIRVKISSKGPIFFRQERIGYRGRPFTINKFRTMYVNPNDSGALLTEKDDPRVTPYGRFLRKYRLDELPQFWNVLIGDMSLVGPRPEQRYYIGQIVKKAPYYYLLHNVRPGITSWGMVKYGYAETVDKMIERLNFDIMYYENMSLTLDITILLYTIKTVFTGKGV